MNDTIVEYLVTVVDRVTWWCTSCDMQRFIWRARTQGGEVLTCCCVCQRILRREKA